jgi:hypothetical protein
MRSQELADLAAATAELADNLEIVTAQNPHFVIRSVCQIQPLLGAIRRKLNHESGSRRQGLRRDNFFFHEFAVLAKHLDTIPSTIRNVDQTVL